MRGQVIRAAAVGSLALLSLLGSLAGCGSDGPVCSDGTREESGECVPVAEVPTCGSGTVLEGGECVLRGLDAGRQHADGGALDTQPSTDSSPVDVAGEDAGSQVDAVSDADQSDADSSHIDGHDSGPILANPDGGAGVDTAAPVTPCVADCTGKACGDDGCGGSCGNCTDPAKLFCNAGQCTSCTPACSGKSCGPDGCGGSCGSCSAGASCSLGQCASVPSGASCTGFCGKVAPSGCSCIANCAGQATCCLDYTVTCGCVANCIGKSCGADGCGGTCGQCGSDQVCNSGLCAADLCSGTPCNSHGSCAKTTGACACTPGYQGTSCDTCSTGYSGYPNCVPNKCAAKVKPCNGHGVCQPASGSCSCAAGFDGDACDKCLPGKGTWPDCKG